MLYCTHNFTVSLQTLQSKSLLKYAQPFTDDGCTLLNGSEISGFQITGMEQRIDKPNPGGSRPKDVQHVIQINAVGGAYLQVRQGPEEPLFVRDL